MPKYLVTLTETYKVIADSEDEAISVAEDYVEFDYPLSYNAQAEILEPSGV